MFVLSHTKCLKSIDKITIEYSLDFQSDHADLIKNYFLAYMNKRFEIFIDKPIGM